MFNAIGEMAKLLAFGKEQQVQVPAALDTPSNSVGINIPGKFGDPDSFETYLGQEKLKRRLQLRLNTLERGDPDDNSLRLLLSAVAGAGKTAFARVIAHEMASRGLIKHYHEIVAGKVEKKKQLDKFLESVQPYSLIFIDEIHGVQGAVRDALLPAIQDNVYAFNSGANTMQPLPTGISWIGATTDVGMVHPALQRRLNLMTLEPLSFQDRWFLAATVPPLRVHEMAAVEMAKRCWTPWEIKDEVYTVAKDLAIEAGSKTTIGIPDVMGAFEILGIDEHGLRPQDRKVLSVLFNNPRTVGGVRRYIMAGRSLFIASGLDDKTYFNKVEPKLITLGLISVSTGGRELTERALKLYSPRGNNGRKNS